MKMCPCCGQPIQIRYGVRMSSRQVEVFDAIERRPGRLAEEIGRALGMGAKTVHVHVYGINSLLEETDYAIRGGRSSGYSVRKVRDTPPLAIAMLSEVG